MKKLNLIIVEDSEDDLLLLLHELRKGGFETCHCAVECAEQLKDALKDDRWQLVISDHSLPAFSAPEALDLLNRSKREIPFIIVSSIIGEDVAVAAMKAGAHDYIMKSNLSRLVPVIERALYDAAVREERKNTRKALQKSEERFRRIAENVRDLIYRITLEPVRIDYFSPAIEKISGYEAENFYSEPALYEKIVHPADRWLLDAAGRGIIPSEKPLVVRWRHRDGSQIWIEQRHVPIYDQEGRVVALEGIARDISERVARENALKDSYAKIEALSSRTLNAMEKERARLSRELHDEVGQALTAVKLELQMLDEQVNCQCGESVSLQGSINLIDHTINLVRRQSVSLRPPQLDDIGLPAALETMLRGFAERTGIVINKRFDYPEDRLPNYIETEIYRCVQESLTNVARHARAGQVEVEMQLSKKSLTIKIRDDGIGFIPDHLAVSADHIGLTGIRERVKLIDGQVLIESAPGRGTMVQIIVPDPWRNGWEEY